MPEIPPHRDITNTLLELSRTSGDRAALESRLYTQVYEELRGIARALLQAERSGHTLQPTELIHEAYIRLVAGRPMSWEGRTHFFGTAARAMRQILVDHARRRGAAKRGGSGERVTLHPDLVTAAPDMDLLALDDCLTRMSALHERMARVVELRVFAGLEVSDVAVVLDVSPRTVINDWAVAKKWIRRELSTTG